MATADIELKSPYTAPRSLVSDVLERLSSEYRVTERRRGVEKLFHEVDPSGPPAASDWELGDLANDDGRTPTPQVGGERELLLKVQKGTPTADEDAVVALLSEEFSVEVHHTTGHATYYSVS